MKKLAVCIPNYNRPQKLKNLIYLLAEQINKEDLSNDVEICINDDNSPESPDKAILEIKMQYPNVEIKYYVNEKNMGMDYNFLQCVMKSNGEYCWIIGNDDEPEKNAIKFIIEYLLEDVMHTDIIVTPFDVYDGNDVIDSIKPIDSKGSKILYFNTKQVEEYQKLIDSLKDGNGIFCFLSNVIFKKQHWAEHGNMFEDKMNSIFIQMYMNLQTLKNGAVYAYLSEKIIKDFQDKEVNATFKREYDVLVGLKGVIDYFFTGENHKLLQTTIIDPRINGRMWEISDDSPLKRPILSINSEKNDMYKRYFVRPEDYGMFFCSQNVFVYGAGNMGKMAIKKLEECKSNIVYVIDRDAKKWGLKIHGYTIQAPESLYKKYKNEIVVVANQRNLVEIIYTLKKNGIKKIAIIT